MTDRPTLSWPENQGDASGPFGATVTGYDALHSIHQMLLADQATGPSHYEVVHVAAPAPNVAIAQVRRSPKSAFEDAFAEIALYVPVNHQGRWWLAAGQNTPVKPGRSATDSR